MARPLPLTLPLLRALAGLPPEERDPQRSSGFDRRTFLRAGSATALLAAMTRAPLARALVTPAVSPLFALGVASGDPTESSVVLWTRLAPDPLAGGGMDPLPVTVSWQVASDPDMQIVVRQGTEVARPEEAHSVHVTVEGLLPDRWYWYRFVVAGDESPIGRTRTFPAGQVLPSRLRFALASCQNWEAGYYPAWRDIASQDLDLVVHVGDYIYEGGANPNAIRPHNSSEIQTLAGYRNRHALYKTDPWLQAAHALFPFVMTWDDHEVDNNYANDVQESGQPREVFLARRAAAYQAYYEHMPLARGTKPSGPNMRLFRSLSYGRLARINMLDTRQYRSDQPCGDLLRVPCPEVYAPAATLTGSEQEAWLLQNLLVSRARWNVIAQQVMMMEVDFAKALGGTSQLLNMDAWDGYNQARRRILSWASRYRVKNTVVLTGDIHCAWAGNLKSDYRDPRSPVVGVEFVGTGITSGFPADLAPLVLASLPGNPHIRFFDGSKRGYVLFDVTPDLWTGFFRGVDSIADALSPVNTLATFAVQNGIPGLVAA